MPAAPQNYHDPFNAGVEISTPDGPVHAVVDGLDMHHEVTRFASASGMMMGVHSGPSYARVTLLVQGEDLGRLISHMRREVDSAPPEERERLRRKFDFS